MTVPWLADPVTSAIRGQDDACQILVLIRERCCTGDKLYARVLSLAEYGDTARLRGFCAVLQKTISA